MTGLPKKYAKMGFAKGWKAYRKTKKKSNPAGKARRKKKTVARKAKRKKLKVSSTKSPRRAKRRVSGFITRLKPRRKGKTMARRKINIVSELRDVGFGAAGAVGGGMIANMIPIADTRIKALIPLVAGIVVSAMPGNAMMKRIGIGMSIGGALSTIKAIAPGLPLLAGEDVEQLAITPQDVEQALIEGQISPAQAQALLESPELMGYTEDFAGEDEAETDIYAPSDEWETTEDEL